MATGMVNAPPMRSAASPATTAPLRTPRRVARNHAPRYAIRRRTTNSARKANGVPVSDIASAASATTTTRFRPAWGHGLLAVGDGQALPANTNRASPTRMADSARAATTTRWWPVTRSPYSVGADLAEGAEATAIRGRRGIETPGADAVADRDDPLLRPVEAAIGGVAATNEPRLEEM